MFNASNVSRMTKNLTPSGERISTSRAASISKGKVYFSLTKMFWIIQVKNPFLILQEVNLGSVFPEA